MVYSIHNTRRSREDSAKSSIESLVKCSLLVRGFLRARMMMASDAGRRRKRCIQLTMRNELYGGEAAEEPR